MGSGKSGGKSGGAAAKTNPYAGLHGFEDNRSAKEVMAELHAQDRALETLRNRYIEIGDPMAKFRQQLAEINQLEALGTLDARELADARAALNAQIDDQIAKTEKLADASEKNKDIARDLGMSFSSAFEDAIVGGKKFSEVLAGIGQDILRIVMRKNITEPLAASISGLDFGKLFSGFFANANGGVYAGAGISAYSGQMVNRPTLFPFARGMGLMGEAGPEAILPLRRGADGKLGVAGGSGGVVVNVIEQPGSGGQQRQRNEGGVQILDIFVERVKSAIATDIADGRGGVPAALQSAYGLNRGAGAY
jgi:hypothetical protein